MNQSEQLNELAAALAQAQASIKQPATNKQNPFFKSSYADLGAVIDAARGPLSENELSFVQLTALEDGEMLLVTRLLHASGQWIEGRYPVRPTKDDPQGIGSALTYARRYALSALLGIAADDDDDGNAASRARPRRQQRPQKAQQMKPTNPPQEARPSDPTFEELLAEAEGRGLTHDDAKAIWKGAGFNGYKPEYYTDMVAALDAALEVAS